MPQRRPVKKWNLADNTTVQKTINDWQNGTDQKPTNTLQATVSKALSQLLPRYPQPPPQQTGTSQIDDKTSICSGFMSHFGRLSRLFSTISAERCGQEKKRPG